MVPCLRESIFVDSLWGDIAIKPANNLAINAILSGESYNYLTIYLKAMAHDSLDSCSGEINKAYFPDHPLNTFKLKTQYIMRKLSIAKSYLLNGRILNDSPERKPLVVNKKANFPF